MMTDEYLHLQVKTIETELSRAQSCLANGDVHASQLHQLFAMSAFVSLMAALPTEKSGKHPEPQEPYWKESSHQPGFWILYIGNCQLGAVSMQNDDKWFIDGMRHSKAYDFHGAREVVESANGLRPCRVIR